jgi:polyhydroxyalkanoate synthesis regulator phasin
MGIYNRDNIDYGSMIDRAIKNRMGQAYRESDRIIKRGDIRAQEAKDLASTFARGMDYIQYASEQKDLENKLKDLEARRDTIRNAYTQSQDYKPYTSTPEYKAREQMNGYKPSYDYLNKPEYEFNLNDTNIGNKYKTGPTYVTDYAKDQWLQAHPGMTEEDYEQFVAYQNSLFGGR